MNLLSLCDGMICGQIAFKQLGIEFDGVNNKYFASEIEKTSIQVTQKNFPNTIQIGDMTQINEDFLKTLPKIDIIMSGTPCRDFSRCTIQGGSDNWENMHSIGKGIYGKHSSLFFIFYEIYTWLKKYNNPNIKVLFENVVMKKNDQEIVSEIFGYNPVLINSNLFLAQNRERLYWTDIEINKLPKKECNIYLKDIVLDHSKVESKYWYNKEFEFKGEDKSVCAMLVMGGHDIQKRVTSLNFKSPTLTSCRGGNLQKKVYQNGRCRKLTPTEYEILQGVPVGYTDCVSNSARYNMLGDGWSVPVIKHILKNFVDSFKDSREDESINIDEKINMCNKLVDRFNKSEEWIKSIDKTWGDVRKYKPNIYKERENIVNSIEKLQIEIMDYYKRVNNIG